MTRLSELAAEYKNLMVEFSALEDQLREEQHKIDNGHLVLSGLYERMRKVRSEIFKEIVGDTSPPVQLISH